jgi:hypothetical protein
MLANDSPLHWCGTGLQYIEENDRVRAMLDEWSTRATKVHNLEMPAPFPFIARVWFLLVQHDMGSMRSCSLAGTVKCISVREK